VASDLTKQLIQPIERKMTSSIWRIVRDPDDADDALQQSLEVIWKRLNRIRRHPNPHALILKICIDTAYDVFRQRIRIKQREDVREIEESFGETNLNPSEALSNQETEAEIYGAIGQLPRNQAKAILMRLSQEQSYKDISDVLGCSEATARTHVKRGRARLCVLLAHLLPVQTRKEEVT
jgi:RNA polymerase sigma factor (sigma-70 family)